MVNSQHGRPKGAPTICLCNDKISAKDIGICAFDKFNAGDFGDSDFLSPLYLKKSSAESNGANNGIS